MALRYMMTGPCHPIKVKFVTERTLKKHGSASGSERIRGLFVAEDNQIYILSGMPDEEAVHVLLHEFFHAAYWQLSTQADEEARVDAMASCLVRMFKIPNLLSLIGTMEVAS